MNAFRLGFPIAEFVRMGKTKNKFLLKKGINLQVYT